MNFKLLLNETEFPRTCIYGFIKLCLESVCFTSKEYSSSDKMFPRDESDNNIMTCNMLTLFMVNIYNASKYCLIFYVMPIDCNMGQCQI